VHWHLVPDDAQQLVHGAVAAVKDKISDLHFRLLPTSYEVVLLDSWNKADALDVIAAHIPDIDDRLAIFIGDSEGDESAFVWVNKLEGVSIRVGSAVESNARLTLSSPQQVIEFLKELLASRSSGL
jgi:trehalose-6-phosphatase